MQRRWLVVRWQFDWRHRDFDGFMDASAASVWSGSQAGRWKPRRKWKFFWRK